MHAGIRQKLYVNWQELGSLSCDQLCNERGVLIRGQNKPFVSASSDQHVQESSRDLMGDINNQVGDNSCDQSVHEIKGDGSLRGQSCYG